MLILILEKLNWFHLTSLITLMLLTAFRTHNDIQLYRHKSCHGCNLQWQDFVVIQFQVSFAEFPQQETKTKSEFTIERKMLSFFQRQFSLKSVVRHMIVYTRFLLFLLK